MADRKTVEILAALVGFDTTSRNSNLATDRLGRELSRRVRDRPRARSRPDRDQKANLWSTIGPAEAPGYILSGHTDVVPVDGQDWTGRPVPADRAGRRVYGRGAADMKGFLACCLAAVPDMIARPLARPIHLAFSYDEEVGCVGVRGLIAQLERAPVTPVGCFVGEPTEMNVVIGHKAKRALRVHRARHRPATPRSRRKGVNAVEYAARLIVKIREIADRLAHAGARDPLYDVPFTTGHTGIVHGRHRAQYRARPLYVRIRVPLDRGATASTRWSHEVVAYARDVLEPDMKAVAPHAGFAFEVKSGFPGLDTTGRSRARRSDQAPERTTRSRQGRVRNRGRAVRRSRHSSGRDRTGLDRAGAQSRRVHRRRRAREMRPVHRRTCGALPPMSALLYKSIPKSATADLGRAHRNDGASIRSSGNYSNKAGS